MKRRHVLMASFVVCIVSNAALAERPELLELQVGGTTIQGQAVANNARDFWLMERNGQLRKLRIASVSKFRTIAPRFQPYRAADMRMQLRREFGKGYEVVGSGHYLVVATTGTARKMADLLEENYRGFVTQFNARGFQLKQPMFPLVAVVLPGAKQFAEYAKADGVTLARGTLGYYLPTSNRIVLFQKSSGKLVKAGEKPSSATATNAYSKVSGLESTLVDTIVHEGIHQMAFNTGVHSRIGQNPRWVVEGLATVFEASGMRKRSGQRGASSRINKGRLKNFAEYAAKRRKRRSLSLFVADESRFRAALIDGYAEAWALSYFLIETRSRKYSQYLKLLASRNPLKPYTARDRLADFTKAFGRDPDALEVEYLRFMANLVRVEMSQATGKSSSSLVNRNLSLALSGLSTKQCRRCRK